MTLKTIAERIIDLLDEQQALSEDIRDLYREARRAGYDATALRKVIARRRQNPDQVREMDALIETYERELGQITLPFERAA